jgi:hypothetical protein
MAEQKILISIQVKSGKANQVIKSTTKSLDQLSTSQKKVSAGNNEMRATSGLNNAILMETSRLASDASFGFTAIANNLSQLVNLFKASKDATGSFTESIKSLLTAQAAFLVGFQLLITFGDDIFKAIMKAVSGVDLFKKGFEDAGSTVENSAGKFETYIRTLQDSNKSQEEQRKAIQGLNKDFPDFISQLEDADVTLKDVANSTEKATEQTDLYRDAIVELAMARAAQNQIDELTVDRLNLVVEKEGKILERGFEDEKQIRDELTKLREENSEKLLKADAEFDEITKVKDSELRDILLKQFEQSEEGKLRSRENSLDALLNYNQTEIDAIDEQIDYYIRFTKIENKLNTEGGASRRRRNSVYKQADLDFEKEILDSHNRILEEGLTFEESLINQEFNALKSRARLKADEFEQDQTRRLNEFKEKENAVVRQLEKDKADDEVIKKAREKANKNIEIAEEKHTQTIADMRKSLSDYTQQLTDENNFMLNELTQEQREKEETFERERVQKLSELKQMEINEEMSNEGLKLSRLNEIKDANLEKERIRLQQELDTKKLSFEQRMKLEKQLTDVEDQQSKRRIYLAELEVDGKAKLVDLVGQSLSKSAELAGEATSEGKALAIAGTLISTYSAAQSAFESQFLPEKDVTSPIRGALAAALAVAAGLQRLKQIKAVKTPKEKGGGQGGVNIQAPDFNVVGASQTSQLAQAVTTQQEKPVKAFVVGKDISTQQELDRNITNTASFG